MKLFRRVMGAVAALALAVNVALAQTYPVTNPTYIPTGVLASSTLTGASTAYTFQVNGQGTLFLRVAGTNTSLSATVQVTESRAASPTWTSIPVDTVGGPRISTIVGQGLYRVNVTGAAQLRFNLASLVGTNVIVSASASPGPQAVVNAPYARKSFSASFAVTPAANATDIATIIGSANNTVRVTEVSCTGTSTLASQGLLTAVKRSTPSTGGTSSAATIVKYDSNNTTPGAVVTTFTVNPVTLGTSLGALRRAVMPTVLSTGGVTVIPTVFTFGRGNAEQEVTLRTASETFALNADGVGFSSGAVLQCSVNWNED